MRFVIEDHRYLMTMIPVFTLFFFAGCGPNYDEDQILDPLKLVNKFDANAPKQDPAEFVEIKLNPEIDNTQIYEEASGATIDISFQVYILVPKTGEKTMKEKISNSQGRLEAAVNKVIRDSDVEVLSNPALVLLKSRLVEELSKELGDEIHDVVFAEYSIVSN